VNHDTTETIEALIAALQAAITRRDEQRAMVPDPDVWARMGDPTLAVIERWASFSDPDHISDILEMMQLGDVAWARAAAASLNNMPEQAAAAIEALIEDTPDALRGPMGELWFELAPTKALAECFATMGDEGTLEKLWSWIPGGLNTEDPAVKALGEHGQAVGELISDAFFATGAYITPLAAAAAAKVMGRTRHPRALEVLERVWELFVDDPETFYVRNEVVWATYHLADVTCLPLIELAFDHDDLTHAASSSLGRLGDAGLELAIKIVEEKQKSGSRYARHDAIRAITRARSERSSNALRALIADADHAARQIARIALATAGDEVLLEALREELEGDELERDDALELLSNHASASARELMSAAKARADDAGDDFMSEDIASLISLWDRRFGG